MVLIRPTEHTDESSRDHGSKPFSTTERVCLPLTKVITKMFIGTRRKLSKILTVMEKDYYDKCTSVLLLKPNPSENDKYLITFRLTLLLH